MSGEIVVKFLSTEEVWSEVVLNSQEIQVVEFENSEFFMVRYLNDEEFGKAVTRFDGMIEYEVIN